MPGVWDEHFAFAQELTRRPIVFGEIGGIYTDQDKQWQDWALPYIKQRGFGHTGCAPNSERAFAHFWLSHSDTRIPGGRDRWPLPFSRCAGIFYFALNPDSDDTGGLVPKDWSIPHEGTPEAGKLAALAQVRLRWPETAPRALPQAYPPRRCGRASRFAHNLSQTVLRFAPAHPGSCPLPRSLTSARHARKRRDRARRRADRAPSPPTPAHSASRSASCCCCCSRSATCAAATSAPRRQTRRLRCRRL